MRLLLAVFHIGYRVCQIPFKSLNPILVPFFRGRAYPNSVLQISSPIHIAYQYGQLLKARGLKADYLAVGHYPHWKKYDYLYDGSKWPFVRAFQEFMLFWKVVARYEVVHSHFMLTPSLDAWEFRVLKKLGRKIVIHYRGCEIRDWRKNMALHPRMNICQDCDYNRVPCTRPDTLRRRKVVRKYGDRFLVTTPDMKDFVPDAEHLPFFSPDVPALESSHAPRKTLKLVHVTNHPGIEGTAIIQTAVESLRKHGFEIELVFLKGVSHAAVLAAYADADLAIGKMKMGYYANAQIESLAYGLPTLTHIRPEFLTPELEQSGLILTNLDDLEKTLEYYLTHPEALAEKRAVARASAYALHDNVKIVDRLLNIYRASEERN